jgi:hypothetical protein
MSSASALSYRERVVRFYQAYAPDALNKVDSALERYAGQEERLLSDLQTKYGKPEPTDEQVRNGLASQPPASAVVPTSDAGSSPPSIARGASTPSASGPPRRASVAGSPRSRQGSVGSPNQRNTSFAANSARAASSPAAAPNPQPSATFGDVQVSDGDDDDYAAAADPFASAQADSQRRKVDPYTSMRSKVTHDVGFSDVIFKRIWEDAWMGKIPYGNLVKTWGDSVIHSGFGWKLTNASAIQRWQKRFFVLVPHFLYYFDSDDAKAPCKGAVYLERAAIKEQEVKERRGIVITPRVHKKPLELVAAGDFSNFTINFEPKKAQDVWVDLLNNMTKIVVPTQAGASTTSGSNAAATGGGIPESPGVTLKKVQSSVGSASAARRAASIASPMRLDRSTAADVYSPAGNQSSLFTPAGATGAPHMNLAQFPPTSNSFDQSPPYSLTPRDAAMLAGADAGDAQLPPMPTVARPNAFLAALEDPSVLTPQPPATQEPNAHDIGGAAPSSASIRNISSAANEQQNRQLLQQQQKLQHMLVAAQQQQADLLFRSQLQQEVSKARQTLHVDESDLKRRIGRIADDRDTSALAEALLSFVMDNVSDLNALWKLMSQLDDLPRKKTPASSPLPQQDHLGGGGHPHGITTPRASPPPQPLLAGAPLAGQYHPLHVSHQSQQHHHHHHHHAQAYLDDDDISVSRTSAPQPQQQPPLTHHQISQQIASDQAHYREAGAALQRQRIVENQDIAARYHHQSALPSHEQPPPPSLLYAAASTGPTASPAGHLYSPSASSWPVAHRAGSLGAYPSNSGNNAGQRQGAEDYAWQERLARMKQRKRAVEGLLNDLPA